MIKDPSCIGWLKAKDAAGYGVSWFRGKWTRAHRKVYQEANSVILTPSDKILHTCDNRSCVNPSHLYLGTSKQNSSDMVTRDRQAKGEQTNHNKLNAEQVKEIYHDKRSSKTIAKDYNISKTNVLDIKNKRIWRHLWK